MKDCRSFRTLSRTALLAVLALGLLAGPVAAQNKSSDVVKVTAKASKPDADGNQTLTITLDIDKPYHLYANPVGNDSLKTAQTRIGFTSKLDGDAKIEFPEGMLVKDKDVGDYKTYEGTVTIKAKVRRTKGDDSP